MANSWYVYILKCSDNTLYTGITNNLKKRLQKHNAGQAAKYTRGRLPVELVYHQKLSNRSQALQREHQIKSSSRNKKLSLINS